MSVCVEFAMKPGGYGTCCAKLDELGKCPRADTHVDQYEMVGDEG